MKKLVSVVLMIAMLLMSVTAFADVDLASMSDEEIQQLIADAQAELSSRQAAADTEALEKDGPVTIKEAGFNVSGKYLYYAFTAHSNYGDVAIQYPQFRVVIRDGAGDLVGSDEYTGDYLLPGQDLYCANLGMNVEGEDPQSIEVEFLDPEDFFMTSPDKVSFASQTPPVIESAKLRKESYYSRIVGEISNPNSETIEHARVIVFFRDAEGKLLSGDSTNVDTIKAGKTTAFEISVDTDLVTDNYDVYAMIVSW